MKQLFVTSMIALLALAFAAEDAEARRLGGARSLGVQRSIAPSRSAQPTQPAQTSPAAPAATPNPAAAPQPAGNRWMGPIAGLAAGLGLGWLVGHGGFGGMLGTLLLIAASAFVLVFVMRLLTRPRTDGSWRYAGGRDEPASAALAPLLGAAPAFGVQQRPNIPAGFDIAGFLNEAKLNFVRLQAANDSGNLDDLHEFTSDEMFRSVKRDLQERGAPGQQTDVVTLNADLLEAVTEGDKHWASVRFSGLIRESHDAQPEPFEEIWNLAKPVSGATGWMLAGIQQTQ
jgi:predicted lipid-binding transport protein (Tim44 family)